MMLFLRLVVITALILYEHTLVKADNFTNISVRSFNENADVSLGMLKSLQWEMEDNLSVTISINSTLLVPKFLSLL